MQDAASELELARAVRDEGSRAAQAELYRRLAPRVFAYGLKHTRDRAAAQDLVQTVLLLVLEKLRAGEVQELERLTSFVLGACRNVVSDERRMAARRRALLDAAAPQLRERAVTWLPTEALDTGRLRDCLHGLSERQRTIVLLTFYAERSSAEIAEELSTTEGNVRVQRHRALAALHDCVTGGAP